MVERTDIKNLKYFLCFLILTIVLLETGPRVFDFEKKRLIHDRHRAIAPYVSFTGRPNAYDHNSEGYRGKKLKQTPDFDIVFLGASNIYLGSPPLPVLVENYLNQNSKRNYNVYNYGISSSKSSEELSRLVHQIIDHKPEMVVSYHGANEIELSGADPRVDMPFNFYISEQNPLMTNSPKSISTPSLLLVRSEFISTFFSKFLHEEVLGIRSLKNAVLKGRGKRKARSQKASLRLIRNIKKMEKISNAFKIDYISIIQPIRIQKEQDNNGLWFGVPALRSQISKNPQLPITSLLDFFNTKEDCFIDESHLHQKCKPKLAKVISNKILELIDLKK